MPDIIPFDPSLLDTHCLIDVRTPLEFAEDHIPGAANVPLLTDEERVEIGTLYKQQGPQPARIRGLALTAHRFPEMTARIAELAAGRPILVYCWRGGLRSKTVTTILDLVGYPALQMKGGYKAYRAHVVDYFDRFAPPAPLVVLHGHTGTGKTIFLHKLAKAGFPVIDLEGRANHRGSAFGALGIVQDLTQKRFESLLWDDFRKLPPGVPVFLEGESRRIGNLSLPGNLHEVMREGTLVWCEASLDTRVRRLMEDYGRAEYRDELGAALLRIKKRLGGEKLAEISGYLQRWEMEPFMRELMVSYYDRLYYKTKEWREDLTLSLEDYDRAMKELAVFLRLPAQPE